MKEEDLLTGKELQSKIKGVEFGIQKLISRGNVTDDKTIEDQVSWIDIRMKGNNNDLMIRDKNENYTETANHNLKYLNQLYRDNVLRTLEKCKEELEKEFNQLGNNKIYEDDE